MTLIERRPDNLFLSFLQKNMRGPSFIIPASSSADFKDFGRKSNFSFGRLRLECLRQHPVVIPFQLNDFYLFGISVIFNYGKLI